MTVNRVINDAEPPSRSPEASRGRFGEYWTRRRVAGVYVATIWTEPPRRGIQPSALDIDQATAILHTVYCRMQHGRRLAMADKQKVTVNLTGDAIQAVRELADKRGVSIGEALRQAIATEKFLSDET